MPSGKKILPLYKLTADERKDPQRVIDELFDFADLDDVRGLLWEWLKVTVTGTYHKELSASERLAIITLYEKLEKLVEAAHVIHETPKIKNRKMARKDAKAQRK